jgi:hypothetical protein
VKKSKKQILLDQFWYLISTTRFQEYYCIEYRKKWRRYNVIIVYSCAFITTVCLGLMAIVSTPVLFAVLGIVAQTGQIISPFLPYSKRIAYINHYSSLLHDLIDKAEHEWNLVYGMDNEAISRDIRDLKTMLSSYNHIFIGTDDIPNQEDVHEKADIQWRQYYRCFYPSTQEGE